MTGGELGLDAALLSSFASEENLEGKKAPNHSLNQQSYNVAWDNTTYPGLSCG